MINIFRLAQTNQGALGALVLNSCVTFKEFMRRLENVKEFDLSIIDCYGGCV